MTNQSPNLDRLFYALADPARRAMVERLSRGPASVSELARPLPMSLSSAMQHLAVLEAEGLVRSQKVGRVRMCTFEPQRSARPSNGSAPGATSGNTVSTGWATTSKTLDDQGDGDGSRQMTNDRTRAAAAPAADFPHLPRAARDGVQQPGVPPSTSSAGSARRPTRFRCRWRCASAVRSSLHARTRRRRALDARQHSSRSRRTRGW